MNLDYRTRQNIDKQAAQQFAESAQKLRSIMPDGVISAQFDIVSGVTEGKVHLSSIADVHLFCDNAKLFKIKYNYEFFEYGGVSDNVYYFCLLEPEVAEALGLKPEEGAENGSDL
ncbi:hypothetical protein [Butyricicoccus sp.]|uniref:hypothetical protein n=1 Tax=Butyricicoccus sp. TaxID=2049021 RepID=UPI003F138683